MESKKNVAVIGSGAISEQYLTNMINFYKNLNVVGCSANNLEHAKKRAAQFNIKAMTNEEIFADPSIDIVVILVPTPVHATLIEQALNAGKHVYTEKTIAENTEDAARLLKLADEKGLYLGSAPDTFMGAAYQRASKALKEGAIGTPLSFSLNINRNVETLASMFTFLRMPGGGLAYDYGVYYITALVSLLGPVKDVYAKVLNLSKERTNVIPNMPDFGKKYEYDNESQIYAMMTLKNGITGTVSMNGDSILPDTPFFMIYGTTGILKLSCANDFEGEIKVLTNPESMVPPIKAKSVFLETNSPIVGSRRGIGVAEMALSITKRTPNRASKEMAYHVLDVIEAMMKSSKERKTIEVNSTFNIPSPLTEKELSELV